MVTSASKELKRVAYTEKMPARLEERGGSGPNRTVVRGTERQVRRK